MQAFLQHLSPYHKMSPQQWRLPHKNLTISWISTVPSLHIGNQSKRQRQIKLLRHTKWNYGKAKKNNPNHPYTVRDDVTKKRHPNSFYRGTTLKKNHNNGEIHNSSWFYNFHSTCYWKVSGLSALVMAQQFLKATFNPHGLSH